MPRDAQVIDREARDAVIASRAALRHDYAVIARDYGISASMVGQIARRAGIRVARADRTRRAALSHSAEQMFRARVAQLARDLTDEDVAAVMLHAEVQPRLAHVALVVREVRRAVRDREARHAQ